VLTAIATNVSVTDAVADLAREFCQLRQNEYREKILPETENQRLRLSAVVGSY